jgi:hypothetical protein
MEAPQDRFDLRQPHRRSGIDYEFRLRGGHTLTECALDPRDPAL